MVSLAPYFGDWLPGRILFCPTLLQVKPKRKIETNMTAEKRSIIKNTNQKLPLEQTSKLLKTLFKKA